MQITDIPTKFQIPWANGASSPFIRPIPQASQLGIQNGAASLTDGYPPLTFLQPSAGGVSPFGADTNGILNQVTAWIRWASAGAPIAWDSAFSAGIGGYPKGALVQSATTFGLWWLSLADSNTTNPDTGGANWLGFNLTQTIPVGDCQFVFTNGTACTLNPRNGGLVWINGLNYAIPSGGVNFSGSGLASNALLYAYVRTTGSGLAGDFSGTGYALNANGIPQKIGDTTRTLVGLVETTGAGNFICQDGNWQVISWFNRSLKRTRTSFSTGRTVSSGSFVEINTEIRNFFLVWAGENVQFTTSGNFGVGGANTSGATQISFDSAATELESSIANGSEIGGGGGQIYPLSVMGVKIGLTEGLHYATLFGAGTAAVTWQAGGNTTTAAITSLSIALQG